MGDDIRAELKTTRNAFASAVADALAEAGRDEDLLKQVLGECVRACARVCRSTLAQGTSSTGTGTRQACVYAS